MRLRWEQNCRTEDINGALLQELSGAHYEHNGLLTRVTCRGSSTPPSDRRAEMLTWTDDALRAFAAQVAITPAVPNVTDNRRRTCGPRSGDIGSSCAGSCLTPAIRTPKHDFALSGRLPIRWDDLRCSFPSLRSAKENLSRSKGGLSLVGL